MIVKLLPWQSQKEKIEKDIVRIPQNFTKKSYVILISIGLLFAGSFGIYLGRFLRWNSWDIVREPFTLMYEIGDRLINPFEHPRTWGMTLFMGLFLNSI
jgi:uncharacterized membrane protein